MSYVSCPNMDTVKFCHFGSLTFKETETLLRNTAEIKLLISGGNCTKIWSESLLFQSMIHWDKTSLYLNDALKSNISLCHSSTYPASTILSPIPLIEHSHKPLIHQSQNNSLNLSREKVITELSENRIENLSSKSIVQNGNSTNIIDQVSFLNITDTNLKSETENRRTDRRDETLKTNPEITTNGVTNNKTSTIRNPINDVTSNSIDSLNHRGKEQSVKSESNTISKPTETVWSKPWASLFKDNNTNTTSQLSNSNHINHNEELHKFSHTKAIKFDMKDALEKGKKFKSYLSLKQSESAIHIQARGLVNRGNLCYIHASLQALLATKEFVQLVSYFEPFPSLSTKPSPTPVFESLILFYYNFIATQRISNYEKQRGKRKSQKPLSPQTNNNINSPFEPENIYSMIKKMQPPNLSLRRQEDSEEFLGFLLQKLHEEMALVIQVYTNANSKSNGSETNSNNEHSTPETDIEWLEVGKKNKTATTRSVLINSSPISQMFGGEIKSTIQLSKSNASITYQPFFSLQLDIQDNEIKTIKDALKTMFLTERIEGFKGSKTEVEMTISKRQSISILPPNLILHIKRFAFHLNSCYKISRPIDYPISLTIPKNILSAEFQGKEKPDIVYKLFAVIYHYGDVASGGHYTCAYDSGCNGNWVLADDSKISSITEQMVLEHIIKRTAYLLFYRKVN